MPSVWMKSMMPPYCNPQWWRQTGEWLNINGLRIFVRSIGEGPPVLTLHAFPTASYDYSRLVLLLAPHFRVILFDYPGYGFSDKPRPHPYSLFENARILRAVAAHFAISHPYLIAHDIGASVALIALREPTLTIQKLVLMNGSVLSIPFQDPSMRLMQRLLLHSVIGPLFGKIGGVNKEFFRLTTRQLFSYPLTQRELDDFWALITFNQGAPLYPILMRYMLERWQHQHQWLNVLAHHPAPLTLIWGQLDPIATPAVADAVIESRPDARYIRLPSVGHYPHWEAPEVVARAIIRAFQ
jgi:pimeloyl-ACP methyl ester carboxylesterase